MKKTLSVLLLMAATLSGGCAGKSEDELERDMRKHFVMNARDLREPVAIHIITSNPEPIIFHPDPAYPASPEMIMYSGGLAAVLNVFTFVTTKPDSWIQQMANPIHGMKLGDELTAQSRVAIEQAARSSNWVKIRAVYSKDSENLLDEIGNSSVLYVTLWHGLSVDGSMMVVQAHLAYFRRGSDRDPNDYGLMLTYCSAPVPAKSDAAVALWAADNGARYRQAAREGIAEISRMLEDNFMVLPSQPSADQSESASITLRMPDPYSENPADDSFYEIHRNGNRVTAKTRYGEILSSIPLPSGS